MVIFISLSYCFEMIFDLPRMIFTLKTASMIRNKAYKRTHEIGRYLKKIITLTNRKYAKGYNSMKEMKRVLMYMFKKFCKNDYHREFSFDEVKNNYFETNALDHFTTKMQQKNFKIKKSRRRRVNKKTEDDESANSEDRKFHFNILDSSTRKEKEEREKAFHFRSRWEYLQNEIRKFVIIRNTKKRFDYPVEKVLDNLNKKDSEEEESSLRGYQKEEYELRGYIKASESQKIKRRKQFKIPLKKMRKSKSIKLLNKKSHSQPHTKRSIQNNPDSGRFSSRKKFHNPLCLISARLKPKKKKKPQMIRSYVNDPVKLLEFKPKEKPKARFDYQIKYKSVLGNERKKRSFSSREGQGKGLGKPDLEIGIENVEEALVFDNLFSEKIAENLENLGKKFKTKEKSKKKENFMNKILKEEKNAVQFYKKYFNIKKKRGVKYERVGVIGGEKKMGGKYEGEDEKIADLKRGDGRIEDYDLDEKYYIPQKQKFIYYENKVDMLIYKKYLEEKKKKIDFGDLGLRKIEGEDHKPSWLGIILKHKDVFKLKNFRMIRKMRLKEDKVKSEQLKLLGRKKENSGLRIAEMRKSIRLDKYNRRVSLINYKPRPRRSAYEDIAKREKLKKERFEFSKKLLDKEINKMENLLSVEDGGLSELKNVFKRKKAEELDEFHKMFMKNLGENNLAESLKGKFKRRLNLLEVMQRAREEYNRRKEEEKVKRNSKKAKKKKKKKVNFN